jgi:hypothetical protein
MNSQGKHRLTKVCIIEKETVKYLIKEWISELWNGST